MVDHGRKWCDFCFKAIYGSEANNWGKCLILFLTVILIKEEWLSLFTVLSAGLSSYFVLRYY